MNVSALLWAIFSDAITSKIKEFYVLCQWIYCPCCTNYCFCVIVYLIKISKLVHFMCVDLYFYDDLLTMYYCTLYCEINSATWYLIHHSPHITITLCTFITNAACACVARYESRICHRRTWFHLMTNRYRGQIYENDETHASSIKKYTDI